MNKLTLAGKVAVVTGASRGVGKGIALSLGAAGATVYVTGRTVEGEKAAVPIAGTIQQTAAEVTVAGGKGIAVRCDQRDDGQVETLFRRVSDEQGRLDILVNSAWAGYEGYWNNTYFAPLHPFWQKPISYWDENMIGVRWAYVASSHAAAMMVAQRSGLIVNVSFNPDAGNPAYGAAKAAVDQMTADMAHELRDHNVSTAAIYPGLVRTEGVMSIAQYFDFSDSQSPWFVGQAVLALASDPEIVEKSGQALVVAELAKAYGFDDRDNPQH
ncbi:MAG: SDR family NAD(P)-dependent oxidoreductase [Anaerolineae bacterium]|nr:SDR family NAD(P)-dependent oxidoreductase [Anaerolineae bacterium]